MASINITGRPSKPGVYYIHIELANPVSKAKLAQAVNPSNAQSAFMNSTASFGLFSLPSADGKRELQWGEAFEKNFSSLWSQREKNGLQFDAGAIHFAGSGDNATHIVFYLWLKEEIPIPPGLQEPLTSTIDLSTGKIIKETGANGEEFTYPVSTGVGVFEPGTFALTVKALELLFAAIAFIVVAIAGYYIYTTVRDVVVRPVAGALESASKGLSGMTPLIFIGGIGFLAFSGFKAVKRRSQK